MVQKRDTALQPGGEGAPGLRGGMRIGIKRLGNSVQINLQCDGDYQAMELYDRLVQGAHKGCIITTFMSDQDQISVSDGKAASFRRMGGWTTDMTIGQDPTPIRSLLRAATDDIHQRLHTHAGFAAIENGSIDLESYKAVLARLYGFYVPFETAASIESSRSDRLFQDLRVLGYGLAAIEALPFCGDLLQLNTPSRRLGARYVIAGSALGGRQLARALDRLLGADALDGRRFLTGDGVDTIQSWKAFLEELAQAPLTQEARRDSVEAAVETFQSFENWLSD
jgi:heme oxygenase